MKFLIVLSLLVQVAFAQTHVEVKPAFPVNCKTSDGALVNWHQKLQKVSETATEVTYEFLTSYGTCREGRTVAYKTSDLASVGAFRNGIVMPWKKEGVLAEISVHSDSEHQVRLIFDKTVLFKKKLERKMTFLYRPGIYRNYVYMTPQGPVQKSYPFEFPWNVILSVDTVSDSVLLKFL